MGQNKNYGFLWSNPGAWSSVHSALPSPPTRSSSLAKIGQILNLLLRSNQPSNLRILIAIADSNLTSHKICEHCYGRLASLLPVKPAKVPARVKCPQVGRATQILMSTGRCTSNRWIEPPQSASQTLSQHLPILISGWLRLHQSSVSEPGDWGDDSQLWTWGDFSISYLHFLLSAFLTWHRDTLPWLVVWYTIQSVFISKDMG